MSEAVRARACAAPDALAVRAESGSLTFVQLDRQADRLAHVLTGFGVRAGDRIAWLLHNRSEILLAALAAQRLGAATVPLSYRLAPAELERVLAVSRARLVLTENATTAAVTDAAATPTANVDSEAFAEALAEAPETPVKADTSHPDRLGSGSSIVFTSGTTGSPKGAVRTGGDRKLAEAIAAAFGFTPETRYLAAGPLYHSGPLTCALMVLARGGTVTLLPRFEPGRWLDTARRHQLDSGFLTPTQLRRLVLATQSGTPAPTTLRSVVVSGEPFPAALKQQATQAFGEAFVDCYGCTELGPLAAMPAGSLLARPTSSGQPFPGVELKAFDGDHPLGPGETGVLRARTPLAFAGYLDPETGLPARENHDWLTVGDIGYLDHDGYVHLVDRSNDLIITGGVNVFPADVEAVLAEHPEVRHCAVVGLPDDHWGEIVCAAVVSPAELTVDEIRSWLAGRIADDKRPRRLVRVASLPTTDTGKTSRRLLRAALTGQGGQ